MLGMLGMPFGFCFTAVTVVPIYSIASGAHPLFLPTFDLDVEALCTLAGPGGSATVEVLPAGALRPALHGQVIQE